MEQLPGGNAFKPTLDAILDNNRAYSRQQVKRALILYEDKEFILGDNCIILYNLGCIRYFLDPGVVFDLNIVTQRHIEKYKALAKNNPHFDHLTFAPVDLVPFGEYQLVICISTREEAFLHGLHARYTAQQQPMPDCAIFSYSKIVFTRKEEHIRAPVFPIYEELYTYASFQNDQPYELYLSAEETAWGDAWLESNGIQEGEHLYIMVDNASRRHKVLNPEIYYGVLLHLLQKENARILIFDEEDMGKAAFYKMWFGDEQFSRFIFSSGLKLREDLCLISSRYTKMVFGPCTGLLHCASGIYNNFRRNGLEQVKTPPIITYTGAWNAQFWWGNAPLVNCLLLRNVMGEKKMSVLDELKEWERLNWDDRLECSEYTADMLSSFIDLRLNGQKALYQPVNQ